MHSLAVTSTAATLPDQLLPVRRRQLNEERNLRRLRRRVLPLLLILGGILAAFPPASGSGFADDLSSSPCVDHGDGAEQWHPMSPVEVVLRAQMVVYGTIRRTFKHPVLPGVYTAEMSVYCTLKGDRLPRVINITDAGYIPACGYSAALSVGADYVVIVRKFGDLIKPVDTEIMTSEETLPEISQACQLRIHYPYGVDDHSGRQQCPIRPAPPGECLTLQHFTVATTASTTTTTIDDYEYPVGGPDVETIVDGTDFVTIKLPSNRKTTASSFGDRLGANSAAATATTRRTHCSTQLLMSALIAVFCAVTIEFRVNYV